MPRSAHALLIPSPRSYNIFSLPKKKKEILDTPNYKSFGKPPSLFNPDVFDIQAANERLAEALGGPSSVRSGSKKFMMPFMPRADGIADSSGSRKANRS
ncbi:hypothetical protein NLJ89_g6927 [Agrocybe chaxingu]|uniref:Uncharacterized protein n=1 Tax=Agrocybe chaxingu TaxID=84603 RepID=A0A9W8JXM8_9AGAR|nr:hypothetical protein NLJ89_g6927 [Agrocybe chaxingu]